MAWLSEGAIISMTLIEELIEEADENKDGVIDLKEFEDLLIEKINQEDLDTVGLDNLDDANNSGFEDIEDIDDENTIEHLHN